MHYNASVLMIAEKPLVGNGLKSFRIKCKEYEVEKITTTAGVRGNEATDEILDYLYYRVRDNKLQIPTKLAEKLNI